MTTGVGSSGGQSRRMLVFVLHGQEDLSDRMAPIRELKAVE